MVQFINTTAQNVNNKKQTVLIETITKGEVKTLNFYCGNWPKRAAAFYDGYIAGEFKPVRKGEETKHYRLLKLFKAEQEAEAMGITPNYMVTENYSDRAPEPEQEEGIEISVEDLTRGAVLSSTHKQIIDGEEITIEVYNAPEAKTGKKENKKKGSKK